MFKSKACLISSALMVNTVILTQIPMVAITFGIGDATAQAIVNFILSASTAVTVVSAIGIVFGVGGFTLAAVQTVKYIAARSWVKAVTW